MTTLAQNAVAGSTGPGGAVCASAPIVRRKAPRTITLMCVAIPSLAILAQVATDGGVIELVSKGGGVGVLSWLLWYIVTKTIPGIEERQRQQEQVFSATIAQVLESHAQDRAAHADQVREILHQSSQRTSIAN